MATQIKSNFAVLDVKQGRNVLKKLFDANPNIRIPVVITGHLSGVYGRDDGISREFYMRVDAVLAADPTAS